MAAASESAAGDAERQQPEPGGQFPPFPEPRMSNDKHIGRRLAAGALALAGLLAGCGGGGSDSAGAGFAGLVLTSTDTGRGSLVTAPPSSSLSLSAGELKTLLGATSSGQALLQA